MASGDTLLLISPLSNEPPAASFAVPDVRNGHPCLDFDGNADEESVSSAIMPASYAGGGLTVKLHIAFASATSGNAFFQVAFERMTGLDVDADSFAAFKGAAANPNASSGIKTICTITFTDGAEIDSIVAGDGFRMKVRRDADGSVGTDDVTTDAELYLIEILET